MVDGGRQVGVYVDREARRVDKNEEGKRGGEKRERKKKGRRQRKLPGDWSWEISRLGGD